MSTVTFRCCDFCERRNLGSEAVGIFVCAIGPELDKAAPFHVCEPCIKEKTLWDLVSAQAVMLARASVPPPVEENVPK